VVVHTGSGNLYTLAVIDVPQWVLPRPSPAVRVSFGPNATESTPLLVGSVSVAVILPVVAFHR
jgi:hypothetical protein